MDVVDNVTQADDEVVRPVNPKVFGESFDILLDIDNALKPIGRQILHSMSGVGGGK